MDPTGDYTLGLIQNIREGSEQSLGEFFDRYGARLMVFIHYKLGAKLRGKVEPDDVLQDFFLTVVRDQQSFLAKVDERGLQPTLFRLIENRIKDLYEHFFKTQKRNAHREIAERPSQQSAAGFNLGQLKATTNSYVARIEAADEFHRLRGILDQLDPDTQELFVLKYVEECTNQDMAERLDISVSTVKRKTATLMQQVQLARKRRS